MLNFFIVKFVDVKNDVALHKIFGNAHKSVTLISFLNAAALALTGFFTCKGYYMTTTPATH